MEREFEIAVDKYVDFICMSYVGRHQLPGPIRDRMIAEFNDSVRVIMGVKYLKVVASDGAHSFIVMKADGKFRCGDVLKAASWASPAKNFARANVFDGNFMNISWAGA